MIYGWFAMVCFWICFFVMGFCWGRYFYLLEWGKKGKCRKHPGVDV